MKSAIRSPDVRDLAIWPLLIDKTAIAATGLVLDRPLLIKLDKTAIGFAKMATAPSDLDKVAICFASPSADKLLVRDSMKSAIRSPKLEIWPFASLVDKTAIAATGLVLALDNLGRPCCDIGFGPHMPAASKIPALCIARKFVSGSREARRASPPAPK